MHSSKVFSIRVYIYSIFLAHRSYQSERSLEEVVEVSIRRDCAVRPREDIEDRLLEEVDSGAGVVRHEDDGELPLGSADKRKGLVL